MAKRKRLTLPLPSSDDAPEAPRPALSARAPIAQVASDAAAAAAFHDVTAEMARAREGGRLVVSLPLDEIHADHLTRDRLASEADEMAALCESLRARGQQTPIEVVALPDGGYGLISGWRRLTALRDLAKEDPARFGTALALLRRPDTAAEAYRAMVEENEIRADLSFFERARIVQRAVEDGAFGDAKEALLSLFAAASYAKRSKIKSFLRVVEALDGVLRHPTRLSEHLGLKLSAALKQDATLPARLMAALAGLEADDAQAEQVAIKTVLSLGKESKRPDRVEKPVAAPREVQVAAGLTLQMEGNSVTLQGGRVSAALLQRLEAWLRAQPEAR